MMRVEAGNYQHHASDGTFITVDRRLSREQCDMLVRVMRESGRTPDDVAAIEISEAGVTFDPPRGWDSGTDEPAGTGG